MVYAGQRDLGFPYVEIDDVPFPLVEGSLVQVSPLAPFSSALQAGSSSRISDSRLSVEVWDNFTGGMGLRDETDQQVTSYARGNLDTRVAGYTLPPPAFTLLSGSMPTFSIATEGFIHVDHMESNPPGGTYGLLLYPERKSATSPIKQYRSGSLTARTSGYVAGFTAWAGAHYYLVTEGVGGPVKLYKTVDAGGTWTNPYTGGAEIWEGLCVLDNKLVSYNRSTGLMKQTLDGVTWTTHSTLPANFVGEDIKEIFTWYNPQRSRDTLWAVTPFHIIWYEEESGEWHDFYDFTNLFYASNPAVHVWRRDENLYVSPLDVGYATNDNRGFVQMFTGQVADDVSPNERFGLEDGFLKNIYRLQGGAHWLYAFGTGDEGGIFALNEFQGWSMLFDPTLCGGGATTTLVGGGYGGGKLWAVVLESSVYNLYEILVPDRREAVPKGTDTYAGATAYIRSAWTSHNQLNRDKLAAYFEVDFRTADGLAGLPSTESFDLTLRVRANGIGWLTYTQTVHPGDTLPLVFPLSNVFNYRQLQWELQIGHYLSATTSDGYALASVALYYSYWQGNYYAYQFTVDLSEQRWAADRMLRNYDRDELIATLLGFNDSKRFRSFRYKVGAQELTRSRVDLLVAGREEAESGGGIYSVTVRDLDS